MPSGRTLVVRLDDDGRVEAVWWPRCIETETGLATDRNYLQLNSIAAGPTVESSFFSASTDRLSARRPGHRNFAVDKRGVIFSGATREPVVRGLDAPALGPPPRRTTVGRQQRLRRGGHRRRRAIHARCQAARLDARSLSHRRDRLRRHLPRHPAVSTLRSRPGRGGLRLRRACARPDQWRGAGQPDLAGRQPDLRHRGGSGHLDDRLPLHGRWQDSPPSRAHQRAFLCFQPFAANGQAMPKTSWGDTGVSNKGGSKERFSRKG